MREFGKGKDGRAGGDPGGRSCCVSSRGDGRGEGRRHGGPDRGRDRPGQVYFEPLEWKDGIEDYVAAAGPALAPSGFQEGIADFKNPHAVYEFQWHIGAILASLLKAGLRIEQFREYPYANGAKLFDNMREEAGRRMLPPDDVPTLPLMFGLVAVKPDLT